MCDDRGDKPVSTQDAANGASLNPDDIARVMMERKRDPSRRARPRPDDFASRPLGIIMLGLAVALFVAYTVSPIRDVLHHAGDITYAKRFVFLQPFLVVFGTLYTLFGDRASSVLGPTTRPSRRGLLIAGVCLVLGVMYLHAFDHFLIAHGYGFKLDERSFLGIPI